MANDYNNEMWESLLKATVIKNSLDDLENYPSEKINKVVLPEHYDYKMKQLIKRLRFRELSRTTLRYCKKIVSIIIFITGISFAVLLQFEEVRAACHNVITSICDKYIQFSFTNDIAETTEPIILNYIPDGFRLTETHSTKLRYYVTYSNSDGDIIRLQTSSKKHIYQVDVEHYDLYELELDNATGQFFKSKDKRFENYLYWNINESYYILQTTLTDENEIRKIVENVK